MSRAAAISAYRDSLRAVSVAFKGDIKLQTAARAQIRSAVKSQQDPEDPTKSVEARIQHLREVSAFLRRNIVQGEKKDDDKYHLHIHKETELGDNDDIKKKKNTLTSDAAASGGCCGGGDVTLKQKEA